jgi:tRNA A-37 threonylcarbamoyl transferase component Bud32
MSVSLCTATSHGTWTGVGRTTAVLRAAIEIADEHRGSKLAAAVRIAEVDAWLKVDPLASGAAWRYAWFHWFGLRAPFAREYANLHWLREHGLRAPEPLAAAVLTRRGKTCYQLLAAAAIGPHESLHDALTDGHPLHRAGWIAELAREVARMHALGFVHRDLFLRNVLVDAEDRLVFIDCRRGGRASPWRGPDYDLACLMLEGAHCLGFEEQLELLRNYFELRAARGGAVDVRAALETANRRREELLERIAREPGRWRSRVPPREHWPWRELADAIG